MTEAEIEHKLVEFCRRNGLLTYKFTSPSSRGVPDRIIIGRDRLLFLELKQPKKKPTVIQQHEMTRINAHAGTRVKADWADSYAKAVDLIVKFFFIGEDVVR